MISILYETWWLQVLCPLKGIIYFHFSAFKMSQFLAESTATKLVEKFYLTFTLVSRGSS